VLVAAALGLRVTEGSTPRVHVVSARPDEDEEPPPSSLGPVALRPGALRDVLARLV
jgi:hypothetical protein